MKALQLENKDELLPYLKLANYGEYNSNIVTLLMWDHDWEIYFEIHDNFALLLSKYEMGYLWMMPQCLPEYIPEALTAMKKYGEEHGIPFVLHEITRDFQTHLDELLPNQYYYESDRDTDDYIYLCEQQRTLSGKKMQKRRNHFNSFIRDYEGRYEVVPLARERIKDVYQMLDLWTENHGETSSTDSERIAIDFLLDNFENLPIFGTCIYIDGTLEAFCIQSMINENMMQVHIEKANRDIRGLYVAIVKFSLEALDEHVTYFNREDDMGLEGLRKAKMDMKPVFRQKKLYAYPGKTRIRKAVASDLPQLKKLWRESFLDESDRSTTFFFRYLLQFSETYVYESNDSIISMGQARKMKLHLNGEDITTSFIVGIATSRRYQNAGYMDKLLTQMLEDLKEEPITILQAYNWDLYRPYNFEIEYEMQEAIVERSHDINSEWQIQKSPLVLLELYNQYVEGRNGYRIRDLDYFKSYFIPYAKNEGELIYSHSTDGIVDGYMIMNPEDHYVREWIPSSESANANMRDSLWFDATIQASKDLELSTNKKIIPQMMVKLNREIELGDNLWINEFL